MELTLKGVAKKYGKITVLHHLTLTFESGTLTSIIGPSGCGKTTILNVISGIVSPDGGGVYFDGQCVNNLPMSKRNIGYVFQNYSLYPSMTAYENIKFPLTCMPRSFRSRKERQAFYDAEVHRMAQMLQIEPILNCLPSEMSGGQQQRVAIARAIVRQPNLLLMDEPFANLDRKLSMQMRDEVRELQQRTGITTIFVTHNQSDANAISNRIVLMDRGEVQQCGNALELYERPANLFVADFFGEHGSNILTRAQAALCLPGLTDGLPDGVEHLSFRPEHVRLVAEEMAWRIVSAVHSGMGMIYRLKGEHGQLLAISDQVYGEDATVGVRVSAEHCVFYDVHGERLTPTAGV